ncbi:MAG: MBL fold metallo-hydrolase [Nitrospirae bacterium]|nr:MBL fold metallo-hydrolase [Nitrospirota bacterium]
MNIETIVVGPLQVNCYVAYDENSLDALVIDAGDEPDKILRFIRSKNLTVSRIICTHAHFDHTGAIAALREKTGAKVMLHVDDLEVYLRVESQGAIWGFHVVQPPHPDLFVRDGEEIVAGGVTLKVMHTPGHSPGGICLVADGIVFTGDTVFAGSIGRTDFYGGSIEALKESFKKVLSLPPETKLLPGHGNWTTVEDEWQQNFFVHEL